VAYRFGQYLDTAVPLVLRFSKGAGDGEEELSESCLQVRVQRRATCINVHTAVNTTPRTVCHLLTIHCCARV